jgi:D-xylose transport system permease protein
MQPTEDTKTAQSPAAKGERSLFQRINIRAYSMVFALVVIWIAFAITTGGTYLIPRNISNLARQMAVVCYLAMGMVLVIVSGNIDLSVGSLLGMLGGFAALTQVYWNWPTAPTILVTLALGLATGLLQGTVIAYLRVPAFIMTLGGYMAYRGIMIGLTGGRSISPMRPAFRVIGQAYLDKSVGLILTAVAVAVFIWLQLHRRRVRRKFQFTLEPLLATYARMALFALGAFAFTVIMNAYNGIPVPVVIMIVLLLVFSFIAMRTKLGRNIYAIGGNIEAARYSGINIQRTVLIVFVLSGLLSAVAGLVLTARLNAGTVAAGAMAELDAIAAAVIGGASFSGGIGTVPGALLGALIMASLDNGMSMMNTEEFWQFIIKGAILVLAVWVDVYTTRKGER